MVGKNVHDDSFRKKDQVVTLTCKTAVRLNEGNIQVDTQLLFQRLSFVATGGQYDNPQSFLEVEMCSLIHQHYLIPRSYHVRLISPSSTDAIWTRTKNEQTTKSTGKVHYVLDGDAHLHRIPWPRGLTYTENLSLYVQHVTQRYSQATVVFDGYEEGPSTKDWEHQRRSGVSGLSVNFDSDMVSNLKKDMFLSNTANKQRLIKLLGEKLQLSGCRIIHAQGDADLLIIQMAIQSAKSITTVLVGDDTDLLVLLCHHANTSARDLFFIPQPKQRSTTRKI